MNDIGGGYKLDKSSWFTTRLHANDENKNDKGMRCYRHAAIGKLASIFTKVTKENINGKVYYVNAKSKENFLRRNFGDFLPEGININTSLESIESKLVQKHKNKEQLQKQVIVLEKDLNVIKEAKNEKINVSELVGLDLNEVFSSNRSIGKKEEFAVLQILNSIVRKEEGYENGKSFLPALAEVIKNGKWIPDENAIKLLKGASEAVGFKEVEDWGKLFKKEKSEEQYLKMLDKLYQKLANKEFDSIGNEDLKKFQEEYDLIIEQSIGNLTTTQKKQLVELGKFFESKLGK